MDMSAYKFTVKTQILEDYGVETPVSGANPLVAARRADGDVDLVAIGSDGLLHLLRRDPASPTGWRTRPLGLRADALAAVPQPDGTDAVFFAALERRRDERVALVHQIEEDPGEERFAARLAGRLVSTDPRVYGFGALSGTRLADGSTLLVTSLAAHPASAESSWAVLLRNGTGGGAISLAGEPLVADKVWLCPEEPGSLAWPHVTLAVLRHGRLWVEWGVTDGPLVQTRSVRLPELAGVRAFDTVRDAEGRLHLFAIDEQRRLHSLEQTGGGGAEPPSWAPAWTRLDPHPDADVRVETVRAYRCGAKVAVFAIDPEDRLFQVRAARAGGWRDLATRAAQLAVVPRPDGSVELLAVSRQNRLCRLFRGQDDTWRREPILWPVPEPPSWIQVYRSGLTILDDRQDRVSGVSVRITADERLPMVVNGMSYAVGPGEPVEARTNPFGQVNVTFEVSEPRGGLPSLSFAAEVLDGVLNVSPERKAHLFVKNATAAELLHPHRRSGEMFLIPENTILGGE